MGGLDGESRVRPPEAGEGYYHENPQDPGHFVGLLEAPVSSVCVAGIELGPSHPLTGA